MIRFKTWLPLLAVLPAALAGCSSDDSKEEARAAAPSILYFIAQASETEADLYTLAWGTKNATSVRVETIDGEPLNIGDAKAGEGFVDVYPTETTVYVLTASGPGGKATASRLVQVAAPGKPEISLSANPARLPVGEAATITWSTKKAYKVQFFEADVKKFEETEKFQGVVTVQPTATTVYRIIADGDGGREVATLRLPVVAAIESFGPTAAGPFAVGQTIELSWKTHGAQKLVVSNGEGFEKTITAGLDDGTIQAPVGTAHTFTLVATTGGEDTTATAVVEIVDAPVVTAFDVDKAFVTEATEDDPVAVQFTWAATDAFTLTLVAEPGGEILLDDDALSSGSLTYEVTGTTTFTLTATNVAGADSRTVTVTSVPAPVIVSFEVDQPVVEAGEEVTLSWEAQNGDVGIFVKAGEDWIAVFPAAVPKTGFSAFVVDEDLEFMIQVTNAAGTQVSETTGVSVAVPE